MRADFGASSASVVVSMIPAGSIAVMFSARLAIDPLEGCIEETIGVVVIEQEDSAYGWCGGWSKFSA